jgi:hypothetical protein
MNRFQLTLQEIRKGLIWIIGALLAGIVALFCVWFAKGDPFGEMPTVISNLSQLTVPRQDSIEAVNAGIDGTQANVGIKLSSKSRGYLYNFEPIEAESVKRESDVVVRGQRFNYCFRGMNNDWITGEGFNFIEFNIGGNKKKFDFGFGFDDDHPTQLNSSSYAQLSIFGDGERLADPMRLRTTDLPVFDSISIEGIVKLKLVIEYGRYEQGERGRLLELHPVILNPKVS